MNFAYIQTRLSENDLFLKPRLVINYTERRSEKVWVCKEIVFQNENYALERLARNASRILIAARGSRFAYLSSGNIVKK